MITRSELAAMVDHTLLKPESTADQVAELAREAGELGTYSICVSPSRLDVDLPEGVKLATVCGFPSGAHPAQVKAAEAAVSVANGADEVDMVINLGLAVAGDWDGVRDDIEAVRAACPAPAVLKVIIESAALTDDQIVAACREAEAAGADFVKTSTGFHPAGDFGHKPDSRASTQQDVCALKGMWIQIFLLICFTAQHADLLRRRCLRQFLMG